MDKKWYQYRFWAPINFVKNVIWGVTLCVPKKKLTDSVFNSYALELSYGVKAGYVQEARLYRFFRLWESVTINESEETVTDSE